ncbi:MAG TPA: hypothetical protein VFF72_06390 [Caldimonas sp.]|nr:hypothetical protein [Caldimonas sp.]
MAKEKSIFEKARAAVAGMFSDEKKPASRKSPVRVAAGKKAAATTATKKAVVATRKAIVATKKAARTSTTRIASATKTAKKKVTAKKSATRKTPARK